MNRLKGGLAFGFLMLLPGAAISLGLACDTRLNGNECYFNNISAYIPIGFYICGFIVGFYSGWDNIIYEIVKSLPLCHKCGFPVWKSAINLKNRVSFFRKEIKCSNCGTIINELGKPIQ